MTSEFTPLIGRKIKFLVPESRLTEQGAIEFRQGPRDGVVRMEVPPRREVQIGDEFYRYEDVTVEEVEGRTLAQFMAAGGAPAAAPKPPVTRWNPLTKTVLNHETGALDIDATNAARQQFGLPVPWTPEIGQKEFAEPPVMPKESGDRSQGSGTPASASPTPPPAPPLPPSKPKTDS